MTAWSKTTSRRGARLYTGERKSDLIVSDLRSFLKDCDEANLSDAAPVRVQQGTLSEGGRRSWTLSAEEEYEPSEPVTTNQKETP